MTAMVSSSRARRALNGLGWAALLVVLGVVALPQLIYPLGFDQAVYAACGDAIRRGGVPIKDCFETKQMGVMVMYSLAMAVSATPPAIHALTLVWTAITAAVVAWLTGRLFVPEARTALAQTRAGIWAGGLYWLMYAGIHYWSMDQAETFTNLLLAIAWAAVVAAPLARRDWRAALALAAGGVAAGAAIWFKYIFALSGAALGVALLFRAWREAEGGPKDRLVAVARAGLTYGGAAVGVSVVVVAWYAVVGGLPALGDQFQLLRDIFPLAPPRPFPEVVAMLLRFADNGADLTARYKATLPARDFIVLGAGFPFALVLAGAGVARHIRRAPVAIAAGLGLLAAGLAIVIWQGNYIQYHYTLLLLPVAALAGAGVAPGWRRQTAIVARSLALAAVALMTLRMAPVIADAWDNVVAQGKPLRAIYLESYQAAHVPAAEQIAASTRPGDSIAIIGDAPWVYTLSGRANATRFAFVNQWLKRPGTPSYAAFVAQYHADLTRNRPAYVILVKAGFPWEGVDYLPDYKAATLIYDYVEANYRYEGENGPFLLFKRK